VEHKGQICTKLQRHCIVATGGGETDNFTKESHLTGTQNGTFIF
jgi:hypothetical protein